MLLSQLFEGKFQDGIYVISKEQSIDVKFFLKNNPDFNFEGKIGTWKFDDAGHEFNWFSVGDFNATAVRACSDYCRSRQTKFARLLLKDFEPK